MDIYKGYINNDISETILDLEVLSIGAKRKEIIDIRVK